MSNKLKAAAAAAGLVLLGAFGLASNANAHATNDWVGVYNPFSDRDTDFTDITGSWARDGFTSPAGHPIGYKNYGYRNDWAMDLYARTDGRPSERPVPIVRPFGPRTNTGHAVEAKVVYVGPSCGGNYNAGTRVTVEARDRTTGTVLGRADIGHVASVRVATGTVLGALTTIGYSKKWPKTYCYQVNTTSGIHAHLEFITRHVGNYACYDRRSYNQPLTERHRIGIVGMHNRAGSRDPC